MYITDVYEVYFTTFINGLLWDEARQPASRGYGKAIVV
jgi:hypothetical protein